MQLVNNKGLSGVTINLYGNGALFKTMELTADAAEDEEGDIWAYKFEELPRYIDGQLVHYTVSEEAIPNYSLRIVGYDLYNTYTPGKTFLTVIKLWDDDRDRDGLRPENIIVRLNANGEEVNRASISAASGWFTIWTDLDMMADGKEIEYTVTEDAVPEYEAAITGDAKAGYTITNKHTSELTEVEVTKIWDDEDNKDKRRPNSITVHLLVNGVTVDTHTLTEAEGWKTTFTELPKYANGREIQYVVAEDAVPHYITTVEGFTITNKLRDICDDCNKCKNCGSSSAGAKTPGTGDNAQTAMLAILFLAAFLAFAMMLRSRKRS